MELKLFIDEVISLKNKIITDEVFLLIQNDHSLMQKYLRLVQEKGLDTVNQQIGKQVKERYKLENNVRRNDDPVSTLISSFQCFN